MNEILFDWTKGLTHMWIVCCRSFAVKINESKEWIWRTCENKWKTCSFWILGLELAVSTFACKYALRFLICLERNPFEDLWILLVHSMLGMFVFHHSISRRCVRRHSFLCMETDSIFEHSFSSSPFLCFYMYLYECDGFRNEWMGQ